MAFQGQVNETGKPLPKVLTRSGMQWYEMSSSTLADLVASINYGERLFIAKMKERSFVNQRLTRFTRKDPRTDIDLCHALLNSIVSLWFLEALGFGRGLGALDLSSTKLKVGLHMLDPQSLSANQVTVIKEKFAPLLQRPVLPILHELEAADRLAFETEVLNAFGLASRAQNVIESLKELFSIRMAAIQ